MSQIELGEESSPAATTAAELAEEQARAAGASVLRGAPQLSRHTGFQSVVATRSTLVEPLRDSAEGSPAATHTRKVGFRYLIQLAATTLPLIAVDLALLTVAIVIARTFVRYVGFGTGIDVSDFLTPVILGFVLVGIELGLYPGIRLGPVEEFRRLAVTATLVFGVWTLGVMLLTGGTAADADTRAAASSAQETVPTSPAGITPARELDIMPGLPGMNDLRPLSLSVPSLAALDSLTALQPNRPLFLALAYVLSLSNLWVCRGTARRLLARCPWWGFPTLVCGDDAVAAKVYRWLEANKRLGLRPVGVITDPSVSNVAADEHCIFGAWTEARDIANERGVYWAVVVPPVGATAPIATTIIEHLNTIPHIHILSELTGLPDHWSRHQQLDGLAGIHLQQNLMLPLPRLTKRLMDIVLTLAGGVVLLPVLFYIAVGVKLSSRGPVLYANERIGRDGRRFRMWKFRSMFTNGDAVLEYFLDAHPEFREEWETTQKLKWDPRITRIGRFIRKTSLDELPQLWNVLRGDMSLVGPRPILLEEEAKYGEYFALYTMVAPGITGMWQVSGRSNTSYEERLQLVAYYVRNWSLWLDIYLLLKTVRIVFFGRGAY